MAIRFSKSQALSGRRKLYPKAWTKESIDEYMLQKYPPRPHGTVGTVGTVCMPGVFAGVALGAASAIFAKAFIETLGKHAGESAIKLPQHIHELVRTRKQRRGRLEEHISASGSVTATIIVTADLPDEARLALLDLDIAADDLRGKSLRWDAEAQKWRPESPLGFWRHRSK